MSDVAITDADGPKPANRPMTVVSWQSVSSMTIKYNIPLLCLVVFVFIWPVIAVNRTLKSLESSLRKSAIIEWRLSWNGACHWLKVAFRRWARDSRPIKRAVLYATAHMFKHGADHKSPAAFSLRIRCEFTCFRCEFAVNLMCENVWHKCEIRMWMRMRIQFAKNRIRIRNDNFQSRRTVACYEKVSYW